MANRRLERAKRGESPDPKPSQPRPESKPSKADAEQPRAGAEQPKAGAEQPKAGAEQPKAGAEPVPAAPGPPPKSRAERKVESKKAEVEVAGLNQQLKEMKDRVKRSKIKWGGGFLLLGGSGWYLNKAGQEYFKKNPDKLESFKAEADRLFAGDWVAVPNLVAKVLAVTPSIVGTAAGKAYKGITESLTQVGTEALNAAKEGAADDGPDKDVEAPPPKVPAVKTNDGGGPTAAANGKFKKVPVPRQKSPARISPAPSQVPESQVGGAEPPKPEVVKRDKKVSKKATPKEKSWWAKGSQDYPHLTPEEYQEGLDDGTISKDLGTSKGGKLTRSAREDIEKRLMLRRGGSVSSDSYMLRKKPKATSEVKKGSRQSRSWNY
jgi:hypothetical protein